MVRVSPGVPTSLANAIGDLKGVECLGCRVLTILVKTLFRCLTAPYKFAWRWSNYGRHEGEVLERVMAPLGDKYTPKEMFSFKEVPDLHSVSSTM